MAKECVAMLLAGGQGSRLYALTSKVAKPAVSFGGKYKIIDFPLSNCINSGIDTVGVLTQYEPHKLNSYIGSGITWDLDRLNGGVYTLPPYQNSTGSSWYKGTANAIYQNINFIDEYDPEYVLVLSGDHIYKMNYAKMIAAHKQTGADATIAVLDVSLEEASRFGIMNCNPDGTIYEFEEKPKKPKSTLASMGIYVFSWKVMREYLIADEANPKSSNDFGKDLLPAMLNAGKKMCAYRFEGYWKDVGTIDSLWEANMDLLDPKYGLDLTDESWKIYGKNTASHPHYTSSDAKIMYSIVSEGCEIGGTVNQSVVFKDVTIGKGATINYSILMPGCVIEEGANVQYSIVAEDAVVRRDAVIGTEPDGSEDWGIAVVGPKVTIGEKVKIPAKLIVSKDTLAK
ncbi:MAG: glucose-1-phosphate adenylyltransferase [Eubacteriales bacterium]